jgi:GTPase SAR1 family protein
MKITQFFLCYSFCWMIAGCYGPPKDRVQISDTYLNKEGKNYKTILIVYSGTSIDRIMLDNLSEELVIKLEKKGIGVFTDFLSDEKSRNSKYIAGLANQRKVDAVLEIIPLDAAKIGEYYRMHPGFETRTSKAGQRYSLLLFDLASQEKPVWGARLNIYISIDRSYPYSNIANKIIDRLKQNGIWSEVPTSN